MKKILLIAFLFLTVIRAQDIQLPLIPFSPKNYICFRTDEIINIDGKLDESDWNKVEWTSDFVDIEGPLKPLPRFKTNAKMLWDQNYFYIAAKLQEPDIWGTLKNRDDIIFYDNDFEVFIDPDGDSHNYVEFEMNALNTIWDLLLKQPYRDIDKAALHAFDIKGIKSGVAVNGTINRPGDVDESWTVEIAFPWDAFKEITSASVPPLENDQWRINFSRVEWKVEAVNGKYHKLINSETNKPFSEDNWVWSPQGVVNMHYPEMWGIVQFTNYNPKQKTIEFIWNNIEDVKWYLRQIYYKEKLYYYKNKKYTKEFAELNLEECKTPGFNSLPIIECTANLFEAFIISNDGLAKISIDNSGLIKIKETK